jgi:superoxide dismutase, Fe-Mn family
LWYGVQDALEPYMSKRTVELHWGKHHQDYVDGLNKQLATSPLYGYTLEDLIKEAYNNGNPLPEYNNAAQVTRLWYPVHYILLALTIFCLSFVFFQKEK